MVNPANIIWHMDGDLWQQIDINITDMLIHKDLADEWCRIPLC